MPNPCKTPGCTHPANTRYDRGIFAGLCEEVCIEKRRAKASTDAKPWTREGIIEALKRSARELGRTPKTTDWDHVTVDHPNVSTVYRVIGGWPEALAAAGLTPTKRSAPVAPSRPAEPPPPADPVGEHPSFAEAAEKLEAALEALEEADRSFTAALEGFKAHPLFKKIGQEVGWS